LAAPALNTLGDATGLQAVTMGAGMAGATVELTSTAVWYHAGLPPAIRAIAR